MKNKYKIITPVLILFMAFGICGYSAVNLEMDPIELIHKIDGNTNKTAPLKTPTTNPKNTIPVSAPATKTVTPAIPKEAAITTTSPIKGYLAVSPVAIVRNPGFYVGKKVTFKAKFDKFSTLGLDYQPAMRSSEEYITLLILNPEIKTHDMPLSELKIFMNRKEAEKHIDLNSGDEVEIAGTVFSKALGDAWLNVDSFSIVKTVPKPDNK